MTALQLDLSPGAVTRRERGRMVVEFPDKPWLLIHVEPPSVPPEDVREWFRDVIERDAIGVVRILGSIRGRSPRGWPLEIVNVVDDRPDLDSRGYRLVALYEMIGHVAAVTAYVSQREQYVAALQPILLPLVASAMPIWRTRDPVALVELWSLAVSPPSD